MTLEHIQPPNKPVRSAEFIAPETGRCPDHQDSLIGTCRLNEIDPQLYLRHVLEHIANHPINHIGELLPWRVGPLLPLALSRAA